MTTIKISYDRRDALFEIVEDTEHGGRETYRCTFLTAGSMLMDFTSNASRGEGLLGPLMDGRLTSITLEV